MNRISFPFRSLLTPLMILYGCVSLAAQTNPHRVYTVGQMKDVKWKGELQARVLLDSLPGGGALYGMGPLSFLRGEIMLYAGKTYVARVMADSAMQVKEETQADAPFFAYAIVPAWKSRALPDTVRNLQQLEAWLATLNFNRGEAFMFRLEGRIQEAVVHVVNLPAGSTVRSPEDAHRGKVEYVLNQEKVAVIGFYSTRHHGIFTHHNSNMHLHLMSGNRKKMGHLDEMTFAPKDIRLLLPD